MVSRPGAGKESAAGVFAVDPEFDRVAARRRIVVPQRLAVRESELLAYQVDPGDLLCHGVLDLEAGVHLEERDGRVVADEKLDRASADVTRCAQDVLRGRVQRRDRGVGQKRGRRFFDELLMSPLQ